MKRWREFMLSMAVLIGAALGVHALSHGEAVPLRKHFADFPLRITAWEGRSLSLDMNVLKALQVDDYMMRQYSSAQGLPVGLYVGYYKSMRQGKSYHSPKNCLPGSGWYFVNTGTTRLDVPGIDGQGITVKRLIVQKGLNKQLVLYWYQDRGRIIISEYWAKIYMVLDAITKNRTDGTFVRITVPFGQADEQTALTQAKTFAETIFPLLVAYLPR